MAGSKDKNIAKHIMNGRLHRSHCEKMALIICAFCVNVLISLTIYVAKTLIQCTVLVCDVY